MTIHLGFEVKTGRPISIPLRHTAVTGQTQESGKTTTLEGLISRSGLRAVAYVTKRGESSFHVMNPIPPYFRERTDWQFVAAILEATMSERLKFQRAWIMKLCQARHSRNEHWPAPRTLADVLKNVEIALEKARGMNESVYFELKEYLKMVVPQIERLPYSVRLDLTAGVNVMDLSAYDFPLQALVIRSVIEWVRQHEKDIITVIPEAWKFAPKQRGSPVRLAAEELIREGGAMKNFIWLDSQDIAGVADVLLRQVGVWIFGVQRAKHEIERTLDHIPDGLIARRPKSGEIATLGKGQFFACFGREMWKVYVQPAWMTAAHAEAIARGEEEVDSAREILHDFDQEHKDDKKRSSAVSGDAHKPCELRQAVRVRNPDYDAEKEDPVWKEKYEALKIEFDALREAHDAVASKVNGLLSELAELRTPETGEVHPNEMGGEKRSPQERKYNALVKAEFDALRELNDDLKAKLHEMDGEKRSPQEENRGNGKTEIAGAANSGANKAAPTPRPDFSSGISVGAGLKPAPTEEFLDEVYLYIKERAAKDPGILQLLREHPELQVKLIRPVIQADGSSLRGRLAVLLSGGFFDSPQTGNTAFNELKRRGFPCAKPNVYRELDKLAELGFVTKEASGYQAVPDMKVKIIRD